MSNSFLIGAFVGNLNLGKKHNKEYIIVEKTNNIEIILKFLFKENFIKNYLNLKKNFIVFFKFNTNTTPLIKKIEVISTPSKKIYINWYDLNSLIYQNKISFFILSTSQGILQGKDALKLKIGGELLFKITI